MKTIGFIGAGNMAYAIISGLINKGYASNCIKLSDTNAVLLSQRKEEFALEIFNDNNALLEICDVIVFAVKPQVLKSVCCELKLTNQESPLFISIVAGIRTVDIGRWLRADLAIVRAMPNTPALFNQGITGAFANGYTSTEQQQQANNILQTIGACLWLEDEGLIDAVTAISGSGPAYFFLMFEAMTKAGQALGLSPQVAQHLSVQTALGAAIMATETGETPEQLRNKVTSKGGTTQAAIASFQAHGFEEIVRKSINSAFVRAQNMADELM
jgi:pyrroline-5-carboxylate reductase